MGIAWEDAVLVGQLLGEKTILNEFYAYKTLGEMKAASLFAYEKSIVMATYILCGLQFCINWNSNWRYRCVSSNRKGLLSELGILALVAGTLASLFTAVIVGDVINQYLQSKSLCSICEYFVHKMTSLSFIKVS